MSPTRKQNQKNEKGPLLELTIENFGPITSGKIELRPLTIFMGSNNSGKSCAAMLIYSIMNSEHQSMHEIVDDVFTNLLPRVKSSNPHRLASDAMPFDIQHNVIACENFKSELLRNFSSPPSELVQIKQSTCTLKISSDILQSTITISNNAIRCQPNSNKSMHVEVNDSDKNDHQLVSIKNNNIAIRDGAFTKRYIMSIMKAMFRHYHKTMSFAYYLPASRYGILQSRKILSSQLMKHAYADIEDFHVPKMPGVIIDLLRRLNDMPTELGSCNKIAKQLEKNMLQGAIEMQDSDVASEISYRYRDHLVPLHRASSMVSEMALPVLYLRYLVEPRSLLVIEEPESHLHPDNQVYLAKCIVDLIRNGVRVLITTHSPYLVEQIGNYLQASGISDSDRNKLPMGKNHYIKPDEIATYLFETKQNTSIIKKVNTAVEDGIDQDQFVAAFESISEHSRAIEEYYEHTR